MFMSAIKKGKPPYIGEVSRHPWFVQSGVGGSVGYPIVIIGMTPFWSREGFIGINEFLKAGYPFRLHPVQVMLFSEFAIDWLNARRWTCSHESGSSQLLVIWTNYVENLDNEGTSAKT